MKTFFLVVAFAAFVAASPLGLPLVQIVVNIDDKTSSVELPQFVPETLPSLPSVPVPMPQLPIISLPEQPQTEDLWEGPVALPAPLPIEEVPQTEDLWEGPVALPAPLPIEEVPQTEDLWEGPVALPAPIPELPQTEDLYGHPEYTPAENIDNLHLYPQGVIF